MLVFVGLSKDVASDEDTIEDALLVFLLYSAHLSAMSTVPRIQISSLLNDAPTMNRLHSTDLVDIRPQIAHLARLLNGSGPIQAPRRALEQLSEISAILNTDNLLSRPQSILLPAEADTLLLSPAGTPRQGSSLSEITSQQARNFYKSLSVFGTSTSFVDHSAYQRQCEIELANSFVKDVHIL